MKQKIDTSSLRAWRRSKPRQRDVTRAVAQALAGVPRQWHGDTPLTPATWGGVPGAGGRQEYISAAAALDAAAN